MKIISKDNLVDTRINETVSSSDIAIVDMANSIIQIDDKDNISSFITKVSDFEIVNTPSTKLFNLFSIYNSNDEVNFNNSLILKLAEIGETIVEGGILYINGIECSIVYVEASSKLVLVKLLDPNERLVLYKTGLGVSNISYMNPNLVINGTFDTDTDWNTEAGWTILDGLASADGSQSLNATLSPAVELETEADTNYNLSIDVLNYSAGNVKVLFDGAEVIPNKSEDGTYLVEVTAVGVASTIEVIADLNFVGSVDNIKLNKSASMTVDDMSINNVTLKNLFNEYTGPYTVNTSEYLNSGNSIDLQINSSSLELKTRKIKSTLTKEVIDDINAYYSTKAEDMVVSEVQDVIVREIEVETFRYIRSKSKKYSTLTLSSSYGVGNDIGAIASDIYGAIQVMITDMVTNLKRKKDVYVTVSSKVASLLMANPLFFSKVTEYEDNEAANKDEDFYVGSLGIYPVYLDPYSDTDYIAVGYKNKVKKNEAGLFFRIYDSINVQPILDPESGKTVYWMYIRYAMAQNPVDIQGDDHSMFFSSCSVDLSGITNFPITKL